MADRSDDQDLGTEDTDFDDGAAADRPAPRPGRFERIRGSVQSANIEPGKSDVSTKWAIDRLDERERRFSFAAAGGALLFGTMIYLLETQNANFRLSKGQLTPQGTLVVGLVAGGLLFGATLLGRRAPVGFVALFTGAAFGGSFLFLGLPFFGLAIWLLFRSYKIQREAAANVRSARAGTSRSSPSVTRSAVSSAKASKNSSPRSGRTKGPAMPEANKRYTPKRPPPPAPKPSRRERKAAQASD
jgi:hypothetical protein